MAETIDGSLRAGHADGNRRGEVSRHAGRVCAGCPRPTSGRAPTCSGTRSAPRASTSGTSTRTGRPAAATTGPGLKACLEYLTSGDVLVVWRLDRLGRSLPHLVRIVADLRARGVGLRSLSETIDTTTATGELVFHLFASLAQYERALIRERVVAGLEAARRRGRRGGRPAGSTPSGSRRRGRCWPRAGAWRRRPGSRACPAPPSPTRCAARAPSVRRPRPDRVSRRGRGGARGRRSPARPRRRRGRRGRSRGRRRGG